MKLNISFPATGCQKVFEVDDEQKLRVFYDRRMSQEVSADGLGDEWKGYIVRITGGEKEIPGLTDNTIPKRLGPKRASKIRKLFMLGPDDDVRKYVVRRPLPAKEGKPPKTKAPKIQRLVTPQSVQRKRHRIAIKRRRTERGLQEEAEYKKLLAKRLKEQKEKKAEAHKKRRLSSLRASQSQSVSSQ